MHFVTILTLGDWITFVVVTLFLLLLLLIGVAHLFEKARVRFARFMSGSWWVGPPR